MNTDKEQTQVPPQESVEELRLARCAKWVEIALLDKRMRQLAEVGKKGDKKSLASVQAMAVEAARRTRLKNQEMKPGVVADLLGVRPTTVWNWRKSGKLANLHPVTVFEAIESGTIRFGGGNEYAKKRRDAWRLDMAKVENEEQERRMKRVQKGLNLQPLDKLSRTSANE